MRDDDPIQPRPGAELHRLDQPINKGGAEAGSLFLHLVGQIEAIDRVGKARVVFDGVGGSDQPARRQTADDHRMEIGTRGI